MQHLYAENFKQWRKQARDMLRKGLTPLEVAWEATGQTSLFEEQIQLAPQHDDLRVPRAFFDLAETVGCHRSPKRWDLLYQLLFRLAHGEKDLLHISTDPLMHALLLMEKAVRRDAHKMKAFVRFRKVVDETGEHYIAWHQPDHLIVPRVAPFFSRRFATMIWTIMTPDQTVHWDGKELIYSPGMPASAAPEEDHLEDLWKDYYRATFNPARIKLKTMKREMPVRHWNTLPETQIIADMLAEAPERIEQMIKHTEGTTISAADFLPDKIDLPHLKKAAKGCQGCELYKDATQTVFGEGSPNASLMLVGEQPGDQEDKQGHPFVGPAGRLLDEALEAAGLEREDIYITNAVKHFRFIYKESFRQHRSPSRYHVHACKPWLNAEITTVKPQAIICLGSTAARALIGPNFLITKERGKWLEVENTPPLLATFHPSAILRARDNRDEQKTLLFRDIALAAKRIHKKAA